MFFFQKSRFFQKLKLKTPTVFVLPAMRFDLSEKQTQAESVEMGIQLLRQYIQICRVDPYFGFLLPGVDLLQPYLNVYPEDQSFLKQLVEQDRCSMSSFCSPHSQSISSGESLIRNFVNAKNVQQSWLSGKTNVLLSWDGYNHVPQLPQIMEQCGLQALVFEHLQSEDAEYAIPGVLPVFYWMAPNGMSVYAYRKSSRIHQKWDDAIEAAKTPKPEPLSSIHADLLIDGALMQSPRAAYIGKCREWSQAEHPVITTGKAAEKFFSALDTAVYSQKKNGLVSITRDGTQGSEGADLARMDLNIATRRLENLLLESEFMGLFAVLYGIDEHSITIQNAWYQLNFLQQHHAAGGWCSDIAYIDYLSCAHQVLEEVAAYQERMTQTLSSLMDTESLPGEPVHVFSALPWRHDGVCSMVMDVVDDIELLQLVDGSGAVVPVEMEEVRKNKNGLAAHIKLIWIEPDTVSAGYQTYALQRQEEPQSPYVQIMQTQTWLENDFVRIEIDPDNGGGISSVIEKNTGYEFINTQHEYPANEVLCIAETADQTSPQRLHTKGNIRVKSMHPAHVDYYQSLVSQSLIINGHGPGPCRTLQEIKLYHDLPYIDCRTILENYQGYINPNEKNASLPQRDLYLLGFPLNLPGSIPVLDDRYYAKAYHRSLGTMDFRGDAHSISSKHGMNSFQRWVDVSWSFLVRIIKNKTEVGGIAVGPSEIVTAHDQHAALRSKLMMHLARHGITCTPRSDTEQPCDDRLYRQFSFSIGTIEENEYTRDVLNAHPPAKEYYNRSMEDFGYAVMIVPSAWGPVSVPVFIFAGKTEALTEQSIDELVHSTIAHRWDCPASACFMDDLPVVQDMGFAFMNTASTICSVEQDGTLAVGMMHTSPYIKPKTTWGLEFAEQKSHVFEYRLFAHDGDWRHAEIPRRAMEYQHPPYCVQAEKHKGQLPVSQSLFSVEPSNLVVSCMKPSGWNPQNHGVLFGGKPSTVLRFYEAHGEESNVWIESQSATKQVEVLMADESPLKGAKEIFWEDGSIRTIIHANEIVTLRLHFKPDDFQIKHKPVIDTPLSTLSYSRYWKYNAGSIANAASPVCITLRGDVPDVFGRSQLKVYPVQVMVSNTSSKTVEGVVELDVPAYWRVLPNQKKYQIPANGFQIVPVLLIADQEEANGVIRAHTVLGGMQVVDEMTVGIPPSFDLEMTLTAESFFIHLQHHLPYSIRGSVQLISPIETWSQPIMKNRSLSALHPTKQDFDLEPEKKESLEFFITDYQTLFQTPSDHHWLVVKLTAQYCNWYYHVRLDGRPSGGLGCVVRA